MGKILVSEVLCYSYLQNDNGYNIVLLLHLLSVIVGTGAAFLAPALLSREQKETKLSPSSTSSSFNGDTCVTSWRVLGLLLAYRMMFTILVRRGLLLGAAYGFWL